jgi:septal ring factor EnvC (AmiA/AmiB activator)
VDAQRMVSRSKQEVAQYKEFDREIQGNVARHKKTKEDLERDIKNLDKTKRELAEMEQKIASLLPKIDELNASI